MSDYRTTPRDSDGSLTFRQAANEMPIPVWTSDASGRLNWFNQAWLDFHGRSLGQELEEGWLQNVHPHDLSKCVSAIEAACDTESAFEVTYRARNAEGVFRWILNQGIPVSTDLQFSGFVGSIVDISNMRKSYERLESDHALLRRLVELGDRDRELLAHEIHDDMFQYLVATSLTLQAVEGAVDEGPHSKTLNQVRDYVAEALNNGHRLINSLSPSAIMENVSLREAVERLLDGVVSMGMSVESEISDIDGPSSSIQLDPLQKGNICQIVRELIRNIVRHSNADKVTLAIRHEGATIEIKIADDGVGFSPDQVPDECEGLSRLEERVRLYNGEFSVVSRRGEGTTAHARMRLIPVT